MKKSNSSHFVCGICYEVKEVWEGFKEGGCEFRNHSFCIECICEYVESQIEADIVHVTCPMPTCSMELKPESLRGNLSRKVIDKWESRICESSIGWWERIYCPFKDCSVLLTNEKGKVLTSVECPICHRLFCAQCKVPWHGTMRCAEFQRKIMDPKSLDGKFLRLAREEKWKKCPDCGIYVERRDGCRHMICR